MSSKNTGANLDKIVALCKRRGFVYQSADIYGGLNGVYDFGHLGVLLKNNIETIKTPDFTHRELKSPILRKLMKITSKRFIQFEKKDKVPSIIISLSILITGTILIRLNGFYSFLLFFIESEQSNMDLFLQILIYQQGCFYRSNNHIRI